VDVICFSKIKNDGIVQSLHLQELLQFNDTMIQNLIHSEKLHKGNRMYFLDLQRATNGSLYLKIKESSKTSQGHNVNSLIIFEDDIDDFTELIQKVIVKFNDIRAQKPARNKSLKGLRKGY